MVLRPRPINELFPMSDFASLQAPSGLSGSISGSISSQRSYGATRAGLDNTETKFFVHLVEAGDTLQRIAIKYGVSIEKLKRFNKIWSNESLFLLEKLKIPLAMKQKQWEDDSEDSDGDDDDDEQKSGKIVDKKSSTLKKNNKKEPENEERESEKSKTDMENGVEPKYDSCHDFLNMIDSRINKCKKEWTKIRSHSENSSLPFVSYDSNNANKLSPTKGGYQELSENT
ncbi:lysM and putative peptidoglycan-binding domain-containing protein 1-like [Rhopilema esculentum]|uniref:lysM and putative peptidoglycan-binding domain-containing protein 1-like n=1 Tax=Rhopilema esculentum TaxID=499914 RepID=UPI0031E0546A